MAATFGTIKAEVRTLIIDLPTAVTNLVPNFVNRAMRKLQEGHSFKVMETSVAYTTTLGDRTLGVKPANFKDFRGEPWLITQAGDMRPLTWAADRYGLLLGIDEGSEGVPMALLDGVQVDDGSGSWEVFPLPDGNSDWTSAPAGEYRITVPYWRYLGELGADENTNWFTANAEQYLIYQAASDGFAADWDEERSMFWATKAAEQRADVLRADKRYRLSPVQDLVPHWQGGYSHRLRV